MAAPVVKVEFGFGSTWQTAPGSITWTDVTSYVLQPDRLATTRGASSARGQVDVGGCRFSLDNSDRRFDPLHTTSPYYPNVKAGVPVRVTATPSGGSSASVWYGTVAKWPQRYDIGNTFGWVPVECYDGFDKLARAKIPRSPIEAAILDLSPKAFWALDEQTGATASDRGTTGYHLTLTAGTSDLSVERDVGSVKHRGFDFDTEHLGFNRDLYFEYGPFGIGQVTLEVLLDVDEVVAAGAGVYPWFHSADALGDQVIAFIEVSGSTWRVKVDGGSSNFVSLSSFQTTTGLHHIVFVLEDNGGSPTDIFINGGTDQYSGTGGYTGLTNKPPIGVEIGGNSKGRPQWRGFLALVAVWDDYLMSQATALEHYNLITAPLNDQTTDERITWVLDELGWPAGLRDLEVGRTVLGAATFEPGDKALDYLRLVEASEDGLLFMTAAGKVRFLDRYWRYLNTKATTSQFTFSDATSKGYSEFELSIDDDLLVNVARLTRRGGVEQVAVNSTSVTAHGEAEVQRSDLLLQSDAEVRSLAEWTVVTRGEVLPRVPQIRVPLHRYSAADQASVLALDLGYRVTVTRTPQGVGSAITRDFVIDGISHDVGGGEWWWTAFVSPVPDATSGLLLWDTDNWDDDDAVWAH